MKKVVDKIRDYLKNDGWNYDYYEEDNVFISGINMGNILGKVKMFIFVEEYYFNVYMVLNSKVEEKYYSEVAEFLHRANYGLLNGNFEMDYRDGEVRYKSFVNFSNIDLSEEIIRESIYVCAAMINRYGKGLLKLMLDNGTVEECIEYCEKLEE